jgi:hypothetical protein
MTDVVPTEALAGSVPLASEAAVEATVPEAGEQRGLPFDVEHLGPLRRAVLDALIDNERPLTVAEIVAHMPPGTSRNSTESAIKREFDAGRIERVAPGTYRLAPPKPPEPPKPAAPPEPNPVPAVGHTDEEQWFAWLDAWKAGGKWEGPGNPPDQSGCLVPVDIIAKHNDRVRKREQRRRDAEAAAARQAEADRELRHKLIAATAGNFVPGPALDDVTPIRSAMETVSLGRILQAIRNKTDRLLYPKNEPAKSWRDPRLLEAIAKDFCRLDVLPRLVATWSAAGKAPQAAGASEASPAVPAPTNQGNAFAAPPVPVDLAPEGKAVAAAAPGALPDAARPVAEGRESIVAAFKRNQPQQPVAPRDRPPERQAEPEGMTDPGWRFLLEGYRAGNLAWPAKHGPPPEAAGCKVPRHILREYRFS